MYCPWQGGGRWLAKELPLGVNAFCNTTSSADVLRILSDPNRPPLQQTRRMVPWSGRSSGAPRVPEAAGTERPLAAHPALTPARPARSPCGDSPLCAGEWAPQVIYSGAKGKRWLCRLWGVSDGWLSRTVRAVPAASHPACGSGCALYQGENSSWKGWAIFCPKVSGKTNCTLTLAHQVSFSSYFQIILLPSRGAVEDNMCVFMFCVLFLGAADSRGS